MANHIRQQIREQFATQITGLTTTGSNVYQSRVYNLETGDLPAIIVYTKSEDSEPNNFGTNRTMFRNLSLVCECYVKATTNFDDTLDTIAKEIEAAIAADITLNNLAKDVYIESTEIDYNGEGEKPIGVSVLTFDVLYETQEQNPDVAI